MDAIIANEPLLNEAYTLAAKRTMFARLDIRIAIFSALAMLSRSSFMYEICTKTKKKKKKKQSHNVIRIEAALRA